MASRETAVELFMTTIVSAQTLGILQIYVACVFSNHKAATAQVRTVLGWCSARFLGNNRGRALVRVIDADQSRAATSARRGQAAIVSLTAATSCLSVNGFARNANWPPTGRFFSNASSA